MGHICHFMCKFHTYLLHHPCTSSRSTVLSQTLLGSHQYSHKKLACRWNGITEKLVIVFATMTYRTISETKVFQLRVYAPVLKWALFLKTNCKPKLCFVPATNKGTYSTNSTSTNSFDFIKAFGLFKWASKEGFFEVCLILTGGSIHPTLWGWIFTER